MKELSTQEKAKAYDKAYKEVAARFGSNVADEIFTECNKNGGTYKDEEGEQNSVNTNLDELVIQLEEAIGTSPHSRETIKDFFQKAVQKYMNCLKIANGEIGALVEENYRLKEKQGEQKASNEVEPKFKVGYKIRKKAPRSFDTDMEVARIEKDYYICNHIGKFSSEVVPFSQESSYELIEQKASNEVKSKFHEGDWIVFNGLSLFIKEVAPGFYRTVSRTGIPNSYDMDIDNIARLWTIKDAKPGDVLANDHHILILKELDYDWYTNGTPYSVHAYCGIKPNGNFELGKDNWCFCGTLHMHPATKEQCEQLEKAMADAGYTFDFDKKELKNIEPKFKVRDWVVNKFGDSWHIDSFDKKNYQVSDGKGNYNYFPISKQDEMRLWTIKDAKKGDVICYKDEISLYKHDIKNCTKQGTNFGGFVYYCCYDGKRFIMNNLYSLVEQDKMDIHPASKEQRELLFQKMKEAGYEWDEEKKEPKKIESKFKVGNWV